MIQRSRPDRVLFAALAVVLATASASWGPHEPARAGTGRHRSERSALPSAQQVVLAEHRCLTEALYYEARSEGARGEKAVAEVVFHRLNSGKYGDSICAVVHGGADRKVCQFFLYLQRRHGPSARSGWPGTGRGAGGAIFTGRGGGCAILPAAPPAITRFM